MATYIMPAEFIDVQEKYFDDMFKYNNGADPEKDALCLFMLNKIREFKEFRGEPAARQRVIKALAQELGKFEVTVGHCYRIDYVDKFGFFGLTPAYGETIEEALVNALKARFGCDLMSAEVNCALRKFVSDESVDALINEALDAAKQGKTP